MIFPKPQSILALVFGLSLAMASPLHAVRAASLPLPSRTIFQLNETDTWFENIAVRANGDLLVTMLQPAATVYTLKQPYSSSPEFSIVHTFDNANGTLGIVETSPDVFLVVSGQFSSLAVPVPGSLVAWELSLVDPEPTVREIVSFADIELANGLTKVPTDDDSNIVLVADSVAGSVWRFDFNTGAHEVVLHTEEMAPVPNATTISLGINGVHFRDGYLYFSNSDLLTIYRVRFDQQGYPAPNATVDIVATIDAVPVDDFTIDRKGYLWAATNFDNKVVAIRPDGSSVVVAGGLTELTVAGDTADAFGRTQDDFHVLYVVTGGGLASPVNGTITEPAKIVAINTAGFE
ncbi:Uu.00g088010.m01.CDS01 [Anthostomella pinea]|uniref:Uu.00g088010.m01.CDS01 n=1 Tax=Anthostomella pinea TaxID=933095 RepID=A0AAI8VNL7_9PEZI|nr:Uu.00g088010.m01.CDS01 [Anthostomella pinea]